jgi:fibronectin-binding autotransporter adhesin
MSAIYRKASLNPTRARLMRSTSIAAAAAFLALAAGAALAEDLNWDLNTDPAIQGGGGGNWNNTDLNWSLNAGAGAGASDQDFDDGDNVTFGPAGGGNIVIDSGDVSPASIIFSGTGYTISRDGTDDLDVSGNLAIDVVGATTVATINAPITMSDGETVSINGGGAAGTLILTGVGDINPGGGGPGTRTVTLGGGQLEVSQTTTINTNFVNAGGTTINDGDIGGTVSVTGGEFENTANGDIAGLTTVNGGTVNANGGDFNGNIAVLTGTLEYNGNSDGNVTASGGATGGVINVNAGGVLNGSLNQSGALIVTTVDDGGLITGNVTLSGGTLDNDGDIGNAASDSVTVSGTGELTNTGDIVGTVGVSGTGIVNNDAGGDITGLTTINGAGATVNADGGAFSGGISLTAGDLNYTGNSAGNVLATGGTIDISATGILDGTLRNGGTAVTTIIAGGQVTGATTVSGGMVTNDGTIDDNVTVSGGMLNNTGQITGAVGIATGGIVNNDPTGDIDGVVTANGGGTLNANGGTFNTAGNGIVNAGGTVNILADTTVNISHTGGNTTIAATAAAGPTLTGTITQSGGGTVTNNGGVSGNVSVNGGTFTNNEAIGGTLTMGGAGGSFNNNAGGSITGLATVNNGTLVANGGTFGAGIDANGGSVDINAATTANITVDGGDLDIASGIGLTGTVTQTTGSTTNNGTISGNVSVSGGTFENDDTDAADAVVAGIGGTLTISGGSFDNESGANVAGAVVVSGTAMTGGTLNMNGGTFGTSPVTNNGGTINVNADTTANVANNSGTLDIDPGDTLTGTVTNDGTVDLDGTIAGTLANSGDVNAANGSAVTGAVNNTATGTITIADGGTATFGLGITNFNGATLTVGSGSTLSSVGNLIENRAGATLNTEGTINALVANNGTVNATDATFTGLVSNSGTINGTGNLTFGAGLASSGTISTVNGAANDVITLGADSNLGGTVLQFDIDLDPASGTTGASDTIVITGGTASGNVTLAFNSLGAGSVDLDDLLIIDAAGGVNNLNVGTPTFAPPLTGGSFVYFLVQPGGPGTDLFLRNQVNPGITALAGNVTLTQSLIGSIINRPSSPFVSGLAYDDPDPCGTGLWARAIVGKADATGNSTADAGLASERTTGSSLSATYAGVQLGGDFACFNGYLNGWDVAAGGIGGVNLGAVDQPVTVPGVGLNDPAILSSITKADFLQYYAGVYATASRGPLAFDLQYRLEKTDFTVNNRAVGGGASLGITDSDFSSTAQTLSGSVSYGFPIGDTNFAVVPTAGFAWTRTSTDPIIFDNGDRLLIDDFDSQTAFVGATVARTIFSESGDSLQRQFVTASYYNDFADDPTATFDTGVPGNSTLVNENLGAYTELSAGWNYVRILNPGQIGPARQLDASIRADARVGDQLNSWGITGQLRLQF